MYLKENAYDKAIADYNKAIDLGRRDTETYKQLGIAYIAMGQYGKAIEDLSIVISISPDDLTYGARGLAYKNIAQYDRAIDDFNKAINLNPSAAHNYLSRGNAYFDKALSGDQPGDHPNLDKAIADYSRALVINTTLFEGYKKRGMAYALFDRAMAIEDFTKAISLNPNEEYDIYAFRGKMYENGGRYDEALKDYNKAIMLNSNRAEMYVVRGELYQKMGENTKTLADFKKACNMGDENGCKLLQNDIKK